MGLLGRDHPESATQDQPLQDVVLKGLGFLALEKVECLEYSGLPNGESGSLKHSIYLGL